MFLNFPSKCLEDAKHNLEIIVNDNFKRIEELVKTPKKSYQNFVKPLMDLSEKVHVFFTPISHLNSVNDSPSSREAFSSCLPILSEYSTKINQNEEIYNALIEIKKQTKLTKTQMKVIEDYILSFRLDGVHLAKDKKERIKEINLRLSELSDEFSKNLLDATNAFELIIDDENIIKEMPESDKAAAKVEKGWRFTLQAPSYIAFMTYATDRDLREKMYRAYMTRAPQNADIIEEILKLREEKANILACKNFAELNNKTMSCPSYEDAITFLRNLAKKGKPFAQKDFDELSKFAKEKGLEKVESFDTAYFSNILKKEKMDFDEEAYRVYFEKDAVVNGLFEFLHELFDIDFKSVKNTYLWHETAKCYDISDNKGKVFARIYLDLEARKEKRGGAWMNNWQTAFTDENGGKSLPSAFIVANFPPSCAGSASLLRHSDVETLFHEAGHAIHHLFSSVDELNVSGVNGVEWDAIEFPSQFLENFAYEPSVLNLFARHFETHELMPSELIKKLNANKNFQSGLMLVRQVEFALFDMLIHEKAYKFSEVHNILKDVRKEVAVILPPDYVMFETSFSHIFAGGYAAGYYSYKWAEMLSADAYLTFSHAGVFDKKLANAFKDNVLSRGGSEKMSVLFKNFAGRNPDETKLLELMGMYKK